MAKYNDVGRFTEKEPDRESAMYHLEKAGACTVTEALVLLAHMHLHLPHDNFEDITVEVSSSFLL